MLQTKLRARTKPPPAVPSCFHASCLQVPSRDACFCAGNMGGVLGIVGQFLFSSNDTVQDRIG
jgi:hypothetical protein